MKKILSLFLMTFVSVMMFAATETTVYYTAPEATIGTYSVKLNVNFKGDGDDWHQFDMTKTALTYNGDPVYSYTYTDAYDGVGVMQFQLFDGETWMSQKDAINSWTGVATYNGKMYVHATEEWVAAPAEGGSEAQVETIYTWYGKRGETSATEAVETGGTAAAYGGNSNIVVGASQKTNWTMKFNKGFSNANYIGITLNEALVAGDKLQVAAFRTSGSDAVLGMDFSVDAENAATTCQILFPNNLQQITTNVAPEDTTFTIPECAAGAKFIRLYRNSGSTGVYVANFTVLREKGGDDPDPVEPTPTEKDSIYFVNVAGWATPRVHLWGGTAAGTEWPGVEMTKLDDQINNYDVYKYVADQGAYANCIFSDNGENQTADQTWTSGKYFYNDAWYAQNEIPAPLPDAVPLEGNIWKVTVETPLVAGSHYINEALLTMDGVYATSLKTNTRTIAGEEFTHAIQVRTDGYPTADKKAGKEKSGSTSLIITAKEDADVTFYYNRQVVGEGGTDNDNKDLIVFDQADITTKIAGVFTIDQILEGNNYMNVTKKVALKKDHTYTVTASGTTLQLHGIKLEAHFPVMQIAGAWNVQDEAWLLNDMSLAEDKLTATYEVELTPGDYEFKMIKDGAWLTKANEGQAYGLHREWPGVAGVIDNATENLKVTADVAGNYVFTWTFANDSIGIAFPDAPVVEDPAKFYVSGDSALVVDAGLDKEKAWNADAIKSENDTLVLNLKAGVDYQLSLTVDGTWETKKTYANLTQEDKSGLYDVDGDNHNIGFKLNEAGEVKVVYFVKDEVVTFELIGNFYVQTPVIEPEEHTYTVAGNLTAAFGTAWDPAEAANDMVKQEDGTYKWEKAELTLAAGTVLFKVCEDHAWDVAYPNDNYQLAIAEAGEYTITITFNPGTKAVDAVATKTGDAEVEHTYTVAGNLTAAFGTAWDPANEANDMVKQEDGTYKWEKAELTLAAGTVLFKVCEDHAWDVAYPNDNYQLAIAEAGEYTITITFDPETKAIAANAEKTAVVEVDPTVSAKGSWDEWANELAFVLSDDKATATLTVNNVAAGTYEFKVILNGGDWRSNSHVFTREAASSEGITGNDNDNMQLVADVEGEYTFTWTFATNSLAIEFPEGVAPVEPTLANGFYLIGQNGWDVAALSADLLFAANQTAENEYVLTTTLAENDHIKVVKVENDAIVAWYPDGEGNEYVVDAAHEGVKAIYFQETYKEDWAAFGGYIWIDQNEATAISNTAADAEAVKVLHNGMLLIRKGDKTYNTMGQAVK